MRVYKVKYGEKEEEEGVVTKMTTKREDRDTRLNHSSWSSPTSKNPTRIEIMLIRLGTSRMLYISALESASRSETILKLLLNR